MWWIRRGEEQESTSERFEPKGLYLTGYGVVGRSRGSGFVVELDEMDDVRDGKHAGEARFLAIPKWSRDDA